MGTASAIFAASWRGWTTSRPWALESIAQESGLDGLVFGPLDLSMALGLDGNVAHPDRRTQCPS
jgi:2-keto-3-deoxy-L-rhamnonate aldolase RhmA